MYKDQIPYLSEINNRIGTSGFLLLRSSRNQPFCPIVFYVASDNFLIIFIRKTSFYAILPRHRLLSKSLLLYRPFCHIVHRFILFVSSRIVDPARIKGLIDFSLEVKFLGRCSRRLKSLNLDRKISKLVVAIVIHLRSLSFYLPTN